MRRPLEKEWLAFINSYVLRPEVETLLARRDGEDLQFNRFELDPDKRLPGELLGKPKDWKSLERSKLVPGAHGTFAREGGAIVAKSDVPEWAWCDLGTKEFGDCVVRATVVTEGVSGGVQLRVGAGSQAMVVGNGTFTWRDTGATGMSAAAKVSPRGTIDLLIARRGDRLEIWVDGFRIVEGPVASTKAPVGVGVNRGTARFEGLRVRSLR